MMGLEDMLYFILKFEIVNIICSSICWVNYQKLPRKLVISAKKGVWVKMWV